MPKCTKRQLVVSVDDYGRDKPTTDAAAELFKAGAVSSFSLMPVGDYAKEAANIAIDLDIPTGVHIVLCREKTRQYHPFTGLDLPTDREDLLLSDGEIFEECCAQIDYGRSLGINPTYMDFHMWAIPHPNGKGVDVVEKLYSKYGLKPVLFPKQCEVSCPSIRSRRRIGGKSPQGKLERLCAFASTCSDGSWLSVHVSTDEVVELARHGEYMALRTVLGKATNGLELVGPERI